MLSSRLEYEQNVGENMNVKEVQNNGRRERARGVAEAQSYYFAAKSPRGPRATAAFLCSVQVSAHPRVRQQAPCSARCPSPGSDCCGEDHSKGARGRMQTVIRYECSACGWRWTSPKARPSAAHRCGRSAAGFRAQLAAGRYPKDAVVWALETLADSGSLWAPDISSHEVYCSCADCHAEDDENEPYGPCRGCGEACDEDFCFCTSTCTVCDGNDGNIDLALEQFTFTSTPDLLPQGDYQDCWNPDTYMAFWDDGELVVADTQSDARWRVISCKEQTRAASRQYYTWYCERIGVTNPCDEDFMKAISS